MKVYQYLPDLKIVREKPEGEDPVFAKSEEDWKLRMKEWTNLKSYPASGFGKEHEGRDLVEGKDFELQTVWTKNFDRGQPTKDDLESVAVPLEAEPEKQGEYNNDPKLLQRVANLERDLEYLYKHLKIDLY